MLFSCRYKGCKAQELFCAGYHENKEAIMIVGKSVKCPVCHKQSPLCVGESMLPVSRES